MIRLVALPLLPITVDLSVEGLDRLEALDTLAEKFNRVELTVGGQRFILRTPESIVQEVCPDPASPLP